MPTVGGRKFAYSPKGEAKAKAYAKKTGKKMTVKKGMTARKGGIKMSTNSKPSAKGDMISGMYSP